MTRAWRRSGRAVAGVVILACCLAESGMAKAQTPEEAGSEDSGPAPETPSVDVTPDVPTANDQGAPDAGIRTSLEDAGNDPSPAPDAGSFVAGLPVEDLPPVRNQSSHLPGLAMAAGLPLLGGLLAAPCAAGMTSTLFAVAGLGMAAMVVCAVSSVGICITWPCLLFPAIGGALGLPSAAVPIAVGWVLSGVALALHTWTAARRWKTASARLVPAALCYLGSLAVLGAAFVAALPALVLYRVWWSTTQSSASPIAGIAGHVAGAASWPFAAVALLLALAAAIVFLVAPLLAAVVLWLQPKFSKSQ